MKRQGRTAGVLRVGREYKRFEGKYIMHGDSVIVILLDNREGDKQWPEDIPEIGVEEEQGEDEQFVAPDEDTHAHV